ncbi:AAA family ATPase [Pseudomonas qingdaonensis]|uniref:AAA family ATPase n=1 Tax=Pseudomonas qingdaonensis TaxID=2056231 RepID=UPI000C284307|nr:DUF3696 domain-containing protein [Pseudomonas qingdaonensis]
MISAIQLKNFKSINMEDAIDFSYFSILCGANSSGKSSLIQAILMMCQSFSSRLQNSTLVLNGHLCRLGAYQDIRAHLSTEDNVVFKFRIPLEKSIGFDSVKIKEINCEVIFGGRNKKINSDDDYHPIVLYARYEITSEGPDGKYYDLVSFREAVDDDLISSKHRYPYHVVEEFRSSRHERISKEYPDFRVLGASKAGLMPTSFLIEYDHTQKLSQYVIGLMIGDLDKRRILPDLTGDDGDIILPECLFTCLKNLIDQERDYLNKTVKIPPELMKFINKSKSFKGLSEKEIKKRMVEANYNLHSETIEQAFSGIKNIRIRDWKLFINGLDDRVSKSLVELVDKYRGELQDAWYLGSEKERRRTTYSSRVFTEASESLINYFSRSVKYLGPLRNEPQAVYASLGYLEPNSVGLKGEYTAAALHINRDKIVSYLSPVDQGIHGFIFEERESTLKVACQEWLSYLGVVEKFHTRDKGKLGYELYVTVAEGEDWQDLTHVGVGVSQVLPIVLMFLLSSSDDVLIFEQPELHLHPKVQSRLCDLFLTMAAAKRQCIIETHSEYMINRLRLRIAQSEDMPLQDNAAVYFISKGAGFSSLERVEISRFGSIAKWPKDFFDQTDREIESIMMAAARRKKAEG